MVQERKLHKLVVSAVIGVYDDTGELIDEEITPPVNFFGRRKAATAWDEAVKSVNEANQAIAAAAEALAAPKDHLPPAKPRRRKKK